MDLESSGNVELVVIGAMRALQVGVFLAVAFMVLDQAAAKTGDEFP